MTTTIGGRAKCYAEIASLLWRHGHWSFGQLVGLQAPNETAHTNGSPRDRGQDTKPNSNTTTESKAELLASDLEALGPVYIKFAQIASTRRDLVPKEYCRALERLQDDVEPLPFNVIQMVIERELGVAVSKVFAELDPKPFACASIGQVHRGKLRDGRDVVIKVQRPNIAETSAQQMEVLSEICDSADRTTEIGKKMRFGSLMRAVRQAFAAEIDYRLEARNLEALRANLGEFDQLIVPKVVPDLVRERVLVLEFVSGTAVSKISGVVLNERDTATLANQLVNAYLKQCLIDAVFHADPHPGNLLLTPDGKLAILDGGMVVRISPTLRSQLSMLILAMSEGDGDTAATVAADIGEKENGFRLDRFRQVVGRILATSEMGRGTGTSIGQALIELLTAAGENGLTLPPEMVLFNKALLQVEETLDRLDPKLDFTQIVRKFCPRIAEAKATEKLTFAKFTQAAFDFADLSSDLPKRLNRITQQLADNELMIKVNALDEKAWTASFEKVANRIAAALVSASLIIAASVLMHITGGRMASVSFALATTFFLMAASVGCYLIYQALFRDGSHAWREK